MCSVARYGPQLVKLDFVPPDRKFRGTDSLEDSSGVVTSRLALSALSMETQRRVEPNRGNSGYTLECNGRFDRVAGRVPGGWYSTSIIRRLARLGGTRERTTEGGSAWSGRVDRLVEKETAG